ncbi:prepilin-type N-terminal cleavage/methylation domain-containing protein [Patescibacteria group bacterium]|nr:prepilin-type N-terminal cleavage/methylation domain-containing protein [Patescibacteria group bacterium]MBU2219862.1 prepilin-type N-terminal cleavage/methylation domain-containing protein [Patescibacteria group bacterium]MBU2265161.1 prepilin-type N-terminal cleavage/methylation domain-containing protein [Patescibacteria group bacterium]
MLQDGKQKFGSLHKEQGFTLIELIVAMAIFSVVVIVVMDTFLMGMGGTNRIFSSQAVQESGRFILEFMLKEIRMSEVNTANGNFDTLSIVNSKNQTLDYVFDNTAKQLLRDGEVLNSDNVEITGTFYVQKSGTLQSRVTIVMKLINKTEKEREKATINLQTTVSSRQYAQ